MNSTREHRTLVNRGRGRRRRLAVAVLSGALAAMGVGRAADTDRAPAGKVKAAGLATNEPTIVTSDRLQVDYVNSTGTFEGNVLVVDPRISVRADKMVVTFGGTGTNEAARSVERIEAIGGVVITQADRKAQSDRAVYTAADGKVVLTGSPQVRTDEGTVSGDRITFWRDEKRMDVESGTQLILYPEQFKKEAEERKKQQEAAAPAAGAPAEQAPAGGTPPGTP